jgi:hypothetical protein
MLSIHSDKFIQLDVRDATQTDLDTRVNLLIIDKFG